MSSKETYIVEKLKGLLETNMRENGTLSASVILEAKPLIEEWSTEYDIVKERLVG